MGKHADTGQDQFYTQPFVAGLCIARIMEVVEPQRRVLFIEPSAGMGAFLQGHAVLAYDIDPKGPDIHKQDWLKLKPTNNPYITTVLGNPPFGHAGNLAVKFFNHATKFAHTIAFILPKSFKKISMQNRLDLNYHVIHEFAPPQDGFCLADGSVYKNIQPVVFQIWARREYLGKRSKVVCRSNPVLTFCKREEATAAIRRAGARAGELVSLSGSPSSTLFVRPHAGITHDEMLAAIEAANLTEYRDYTASVRAVSASEINLKLSKISA